MYGLREFPFSWLVNSYWQDTNEVGGNYPNVCFPPVLPLPLNWITHSTETGPERITQVFSFSIYLHMTRCSDLTSWMWTEETGSNGTTTTLGGLTTALWSLRACYWSKISGKNTWQVGTSRLQTTLTVTSKPHKSWLDCLRPEKINRSPGLFRFHRAHTQRSQEKIT